MLVHHPVCSAHRTIELEPMDHVVIDPDADIPTAEMTRRTQPRMAMILPLRTQISPSRESNEAPRVLDGWVDNQPF
jgi:hypothetical protein